jgi:hypothetical protein
VATDSTTVWRVLAPDGAVQGVLSLPDRVAPRRVQVGRMWGIGRDELDVPYIVRYRIELP